MVKHFFIGWLLLLLAVKECAAQLPPKRELRAIWIATVENIDWPSRRGISTEQQKQEFINILNEAQKMGMNAIVFQVRPVSDAFYASPYEPWSEYLTGTQGQAPNPYYDPLAFMIEETHKRGMEFHAWFNPYRAVFNVSRSKVANNHVSRLNPSWFVTYGDRKYFDPGIPEGRDFVVNVIRDVVRRYDIDAVHFDDYFYPYRIANKEFPDNFSYAKYGKGMQRDDWRRKNVDDIIQLLDKAIKAEKPYVKFGISPFGVWRNNDRDMEGSPTRGGMTNYDDLYADVLKWLKNGWIDYVTPQLYWEYGHRLVGYEVLVRWWNDHAYGKHVYIGHGVYQIGSNAAWRNPYEIPRQILMNRTYPNVKGSMFFSYKSFANNPLGIKDSLANHLFKYPALIPTMPWIKAEAPFAPYFTDAFEKPNGIEIRWADDDTSGRTKQYVLYRFTQSEPINLNDPTKILALVQQMPDPVFIDNTFTRGQHYIYYVTALDRLQNESVPSEPMRISTTGNKFYFKFE
ncbi:uncharacterized lipoprotein YddW (UPF0748 family) [Chitinophaga skermanii]|uniref:Uncharacterized lipoprotein YddW (UPF0748 family) n=1 Tax=Chitinophaga skermanii TaxID=331697 RepID=A0A327QA48_9BACT|nr:family 10 glycosylhydrolase [Chitinophaga skermanii]RAI98686.1 uncharacterized lipoprotein YddW (UPF0748 family) [Chitinophaga skermanii]